MTRLVATAAAVEAAAARGLITVPPAPAKKPAVDRTSLAAVKQVWQQVYAAAPEAFDRDAPRPLALGAFDEVAALDLVDISGPGLHRFFAWWSTRPAYLRAIAAGGYRFHIDGSPATEISDEHRQGAAQRLAAGPR